MKETVGGTHKGKGFQTAGTAGMCLVLLGSSTGGQCGYSGVSKGKNRHGRGCGRMVGIHMGHWKDLNFNSKQN